MVEYCEIQKNGIFENSRFSAWAQNSLQSSHKLLVMTEKVKTVIGCIFLLPDFFNFADTLYTFLGMFIAAWGLFTGFDEKFFWWYANRWFDILTN